MSNQNPEKAESLKKSGVNSGLHKKNSIYQPELIEICKDWVYNQVILKRGVLL